MSMRVLFDNNFFSWYCNHEVNVDFRPEDERDTLVARFENLIRYLDANASEIVVPAPVLGEALCHKGTDPRRVLRIIENEVRFRIVPFDRRTAEEFGHLFRNYPRTDEENRLIYKFDLQLLAIAAVERVDVIYSSDGPLKRVAAGQGIRCVTFQELPRPCESRQEELFSADATEFGTW